MSANYESTNMFCISSKEHVIKLLAITIYHLYSIDQLKTVNVYGYKFLEIFYQ